MPSAVGLEKPDQYLYRNFSFAARYRRADEKLPAGAKVLAFGESRLFRFPRPTIASTTEDLAAVTPFLRGAASPSEVLTRLRERGVGYLLVSLDAFRPDPTSAVWRRGLSGEDLSLFSQTIRLCRILDRESSLRLLELPPAGPVQ